MYMHMCLYSWSWLYNTLFESHKKLLKWYLILPCLILSVIRCVSRVSGPIQVKAQHPLAQGVVAIEKGAFGSPSITFSQLTYLYFSYCSSSFSSPSPPITPSSPATAVILNSVLSNSFHNDLASTTSNE